jgi:alpha-tubulin suppressor-like RCC1 family protein
MIRSIPNKINTISIGRTMSTVLDQTHMLWVFGDNQNGELGVGDKTARITPFPVVSLQKKGISNVSIGSNYAIALTKSEPVVLKDSLTKDDIVSSEQKIVTVNNFPSRIVKSTVALPPPLL